MPTPLLPPEIDTMLSEPGVYRVNVKGSPYYFFCEVEADRTCHQLNPHTMKRDGVLRESGWNMQAKYLIGKQVNA